ncbi:1334_t:CDS:2, partial [Funneliformis mosseae]
PTTARHNKPNQSSNLLAKHVNAIDDKHHAFLIKCDGDAESGKPATPNFVNMTTRLAKTNRHEITEKLTIKKLEKKILCMLFESKEHFNSPELLQLFIELKDAIRLDRCIKPILVII